MHTTLQLQAALLLFLGGVVFLAHKTSQTTRGRRGAGWFFGACASGGLGLALQSERGQLSPILTIVAGNLLFLTLTVLLTKAVELTVQKRSRWIPCLCGLCVLAASALAYYTFARPDVTRRVLIISGTLPVLFTPMVGLLLSAKKKTMLGATRTLAGILLTFIVCCLLRVVSILHGARPTTGANWTGAVLIAGLAVCFLWLDFGQVRFELEEQAMTDPLTGLLNRRALEVMAEREVARATRLGTSVSLLTVDIDHFKQINDRYGHMIGDHALTGVAGILSKSVRKHDLAVRTGGDEFLVLLTESSEMIASATVRRIVKQVKDLQLTAHDGKPFHISVTVGSFTSSKGNTQTYADLVHASDIDLYLLKERRHSAPYNSSVSNSVNGSLA